MALQSCYECNKEISTKAIICPQCGAPQNPVSGLMDKAKRFFSKKKEEARKEKEIERQKEKREWILSSPEARRRLKLFDLKNPVPGVMVRSINDATHYWMPVEEENFYRILDFEDKDDFYFDPHSTEEERRKQLEDLEVHNAMKRRREKADQGDADAQHNLGFMYHEGLGVPQDYLLAHMWFNLSASNGNEYAIKKRTMIEKKMTPQQIEKAQEMAKNWTPF